VEFRNLKVFRELTLGGTGKIFEKVSLPVFWKIQQTFSDFFS